MPNSRRLDTRASRWQPMVPLVVLLAAVFPLSEAVVLWEPTPEAPVRVHHVLNYTMTHSKGGGIAKQMYNVVRAVETGCGKANAVYTPGDPPSFGVVLLPPLPADLPKTPGFHDLQAFGDIFDVGALAEEYRQQSGCLLSEPRAFALLVESGAVVLADQLEVSSGKQLGGAKRPHTSSHHTTVYQRLALSQRLREQVYDPCLAKIQEQFGPGEPYMAVHLRIEDDWIGKYCKNWDQAHHEELYREYRDHRTINGKKAKVFVRSCYSPAGVAEEIDHTPALREYKNILLLYAAENHMAPGHSRVDYLTADPLAVWPSNVTVVSPAQLQCFGPEMTYTEKAAVSWALGSAADAFAGMVQSTLSVGIVKAQQGKGNLDHCYFYDCPSSGYQSAVQVHSTRNLPAAC